MAPSTAPAASPAGASATGSAARGAAGDRPLGSVFVAARDVAARARSGRVTGTITSEGERVALDLRGTRDGSNQSLQMTSAGLGGTLTVRTVAGRFYLLGDERFWAKNAGDEAAAHLAGRAVLMDPADARSFGAYTLGSLLDELLGDAELSPLATLTTPVAPSTSGGAPAYVLADPAHGTGEVVVSADGRSRLVRLRTGGSEPVALAFSEWDGVAPVPAPAAKDVVRL